MKTNKFTKAAIEAALSAGKILLKYYSKPISIGYKGKIDPVTNADHESQRAILKILKGEFPDHAFMAEEGGEKLISNEYCWMIDPLDGTVNFIHGLPIFSVSIGLAYKHEVIAAVVYAPVLNELFVAQKGCGAFLNGKRLKVSRTRKMLRALAVTGFPYYVHTERRDMLKSFERVLAKAQGMRRLGSAAIDISYIAAGRFDAYWEENLKPWDVAAGSLILKEAGGKITDYAGRDNYIFGSELVATNGLLHKEMIRLVGTQK